MILWLSKDNMPVQTKKSNITFNTTMTLERLPQILFFTLYAQFQIETKIQIVYIFDIKKIIIFIDQVSPMSKPRYNRNNKK